MHMYTHISLQQKKIDEFETNFEKKVYYNNIDNVMVVVMASNNVSFANIYIVLNVAFLALCSWCQEECC